MKGYSITHICCNLSLCKRKKWLGRAMCRWEDNIRMDLRKIV